jgi:hypothetical protein
MSKIHDKITRILCRGKDAREELIHYQKAAEEATLDKEHAKEVEISLRDLREEYANIESKYAKFRDYEFMTNDQKFAIDTFWDTIKNGEEVCVKKLKSGKVQVVVTPHPEPTQLIPSVGHPNWKIGETHEDNLHRS